jgi:hypothetical protein
MCKQIMMRLQNWHFKTREIIKSSWFHLLGNAHLFIEGITNYVDTRSGYQTIS